MGHATFSKSGKFIAGENSYKIMNEVVTYNFKGVPIGPYLLFLKRKIYGFVYYGLKYIIWEFCV